MNTSLNGIKFGIDTQGNYGYYKVGADTVTPFKTGNEEKNTSYKSLIKTNSGVSTVDITGWKIIIQYQRLGSSSSSFCGWVFVKGLMKKFKLYTNSIPVSDFSYGELQYTNRTDTSYANDYYMKIYENKIEYSYGIIYVFF